MVGPRLRPRFEINAPFTVEEILERLTQHSQQEACGYEGTVAGHHVHLNIRKSEQRIWSPHLNLEVLPGTTGSLIKGHFGPRPDIWTLVMALYAIFGFLALMALMFAVSQWMLGMPAWALWIVGGAVGLGLGVYALALTGQALSQDQMQALLEEVENAVGVEHSVRDS